MGGEIGLHSLSPLSSDKAATFWVVMTSCSHFTLPLNLTNRPHSEVKSRAQHTTCSCTTLHTNATLTVPKTTSFRKDTLFFVYLLSSFPNRENIIQSKHLSIWFFVSFLMQIFGLVCIISVFQRHCYCVVYLIHSYGYGQNQSNYTHFLLKRSRSGLEYLSA